MLKLAGPVVAMATPSDGTFSWAVVVPYLLIIGIMYFVLIQPMRKKEQKAREFRESLKVGDRVVTTSGIYGEVTRINQGADTVQLQIADKLRIEIAKAAIGGFQGKPQVVETAPQ